MPVIFLETGKLFPETLAYRDALVARLGLTDVRSVAAERGDARLRRSGRHAVALRSEPLLLGAQGRAAGRGAPGVRGVDHRPQAVPGRQAHQLALVESGDDGRTKVNPLAFWGEAELSAYFAAHDLPRHPLEARGYRSIGCVGLHPSGASPARTRARAAGPGSDKTECGIHDRSAVVDARGAGI